MRITTDASWIIEWLTVLAIVSVWDGSKSFLAEPSQTNLVPVLIAIASLAACSLWLRQAIRTRTRIYLGNDLTIFFTVVGGVTWFCFLIATRNWIDIPITLILILFGVFLLWKIPKEPVLS